jgi:hypothetical protein
MQKNSKESACCQTHLTAAIMFTFIGVASPLKPVYLLLITRAGTLASTSIAQVSSSKTAQRHI